MRLIVYLTTIFWALSASTQTQTVLRYNFGLTIDESQFVSNSPNYEYFGSSAGTTSLYVSHSFNKLISLEVGLQDRFFGVAVRGTSPDTHIILASSNYLDFPIKLILNQSINQRLSFQQRIGMNLSVSHTYSGVNTEYTFVNYPIFINTNFPKFYATANLGLGFSWHFTKSKSWVINTSYDYLISFKPILDVRFNDPNQLEYGHIKSSGNYHIVLLGIGYRISNFWQKKNKSEEG